jgi:hypothetical protein
MSFSHLHVQTQFSLLDGAASIPSLHHEQSSDFAGRFPAPKGKMEVKLSSLLKFKEEGLNVHHTAPTLDLTGYVKDTRAAKRSFELTIGGVCELYHQQGCLGEGTEANGVEGGWR